MKNILKKTGWGLLVTLTFFACKKDQKQETLSNDAKNWYLKTSQGTSYALKSNTNQILQVSQQADWNNAQTFQLNDGTEVLGIPLSFKLANNKTTKGSYLLIISRDGENFKKLTVYNEEKEFYKKVSKEKVQGAYVLGNQLLQLQKKANNNPARGKIMSEENGGGQSDEPVCINWYLVETYRDAEGNVTAVVETFLYQTCYSTGGSGGGGGGNEGGNDTIDWGSPTDEELSETAIPEEDPTGEKIENRHYKWTFHKALNEGFWLKSYEKGKVKKVGSGPWKFTSFTHLNAAPVGMVVGREIELVMLDSDVTFNDDDAKVSLWYKIHRIGNGFGTVLPYYSPDFSKDKKFYANPH